ncbi:MAG: hypothetical protein AAFR96_04490 [Planctomycetota bacterium]
MTTLLMILGIILGAVAAAIVFVFLFVPLIKTIGKVIAHVFGTIGRWITDLFRLVGTILVIPVFMLLAALSVIIGRWSASTHYGRAVTGESKSAVLCLYRISIGHPLRLFGLHALVEGFERRLPEVVAAAPGRDKPAGRKSQFEGYDIVGSLKGGGSGGKLYIAQPDDLKHAAFVKRGLGSVDQVVIKAFSVHEGSTLPQIIRESRALDAAKRLGLILEHDLTNERFFYVMEYIPGEPMSIVTQRAHADAGPEGLGDAAIGRLLGYSRDVLVTLDRYHTGGLWHKDIKPDNIIVDHDQGRAAVVDLGLITPLRSAMTLTTHGTEYFRDPELVRMALKGVKVNEVNGEKFDIYAAAAVMYAAIEGSFPAHGGLSQISKRCPEAIRWIIRRGMTDYDKRYESVADMLRDLDVVLQAAEPFDVKPAMLPSVGGAEPTGPEVSSESSPEPFIPPAAAVSYAPAPAPADRAAPATPSEPTPAAAPAEMTPALKLANWWSGRYEVEEPTNAGEPPADRANESPRTEAVRRTPRPAPNPGRRPAQDQLKNARARAAERRERAVKRVATRRQSLRQQREKASGLHPAAAIAIGCLVGLVSIPVTAILLSDDQPGDPFASPAVAAAPFDPNRSPAQAAVHAPARADARGTPTPPIPPATATGILSASSGDATATRSTHSATASVVVVSTFNQPVDPGIAKGLGKAIESLRIAGYTVADAANNATPEGVDLLADVRAERGLGASQAWAASRQLSEWFNTADTRYDALIVIEPEPEAIARGITAARALIVDDDSYTSATSLDPESLAHKLREVTSD